MRSGRVQQILTSYATFHFKVSRVVSKQLNRIIVVKHCNCICCVETLPQCFRMGNSKLRIGSKKRT